MKTVTANILRQILMSPFNQDKFCWLLWIYSGFSRITLSMQHMMLMENCLKQVLKQDSCLVWTVTGRGPWQWLTPGASKESEWTPVWKAPVKEELSIGYLSQTLKQRGFYPFNISKVTLNTILTKSLWQTIVFQESPLRSLKAEKEYPWKVLYDLISTSAVSNLSSVVIVSPFFYCSHAKCTTVRDAVQLISPHQRRTLLSIALNQHLYLISTS